VSEHRRLEVLRPSVNVDTLKDGRGGIVTWVPPDEIVEFNLIDTKSAARLASFRAEYRRLTRWSMARR
jgi:hypothetical protein